MRRQRRNSGTKTKVPINGLGRISCAILKLTSDEPSMEVVTVNNLADVESHAYLLRVDTAYGLYSKPVTVDPGDLVITDRMVRTLNIRDPAELVWKKLGVELVFECTGAFPRQGHNAHDPMIMATYPPADITVERIGVAVTAGGNHRAIRPA